MAFTEEVVLFLFLFLLFSLGVDIKRKKKKGTEQTREVYILCSGWRCDSTKIYFVAIQEESLLKNGLL